MDDDLLNYLDTLTRGDCYRVDALLKDSAREVTERVYLIAANGSERGPYIRKRIALDSGLGEAYERLWQAQRAGRRFMHLPSILECTVEDGQRCVVMEHVEGLTLDEATLSFDYSPQRAATIAVLLCDAVMELHESFTPPLIHRDLKPTNVIVSESNLTLIDFGIARTYDADATTDTRSFGTRGYAPPEQFGYGQTDERSDVYALGMLMAFCFLREEPSRALVESGFDDPRIPAVIRPVLMRATAFDPGQRYESVMALKSDPLMERLVTEVLEKPTELQVDAESEDAAKILAASATPTAPVGSVSSQASDMNQGLSHRIPRGVGIAWNTVVAAAWLLFVVAAISLTVAPNEVGQAMTPLERSIGYLGTCIVGLGFVAYAIMDRRWLRKRFAWARRFPWYGESALCIIIALFVMMLAAGLSMLFANL